MGLDPSATTKPRRNRPVPPRRRAPGKIRPDLWTDPRGSEPKLGQQGVVLAQTWAPLRRCDTVHQRWDRHSKIEVVGLY